MTDHEALFSKMQNQEKLLEKQNEKLERIEASLTQIAVQGKEIHHLNSQIDSLWRKYDAVLGPDGTLAVIKTYQAGCPGESLKKAISQLWTTIWTVATLLVALITGMKLWG